MLQNIQMAYTAFPLVNLKFDFFFNLSMLNLEQNFLAGNLINLHIFFLSNSSPHISKYNNDNLCFMDEMLLLCYCKI